MSILNSMFDASQMGEPARLDYAISEHEKLAAQVEALIALLCSKELITEDEASRLTHGPAARPE